MESSVTQRVRKRVKVRVATYVADSLSGGSKRVLPRGTVTHYAIMWGHVADATDRSRKATSFRIGGC